MWQELSQYPGRPGMSLVDGLAAVADAYAAASEPEAPPADPATGFGESLYPLIGLLSELLDGGYGWTVKRRAARARLAAAADEAYGRDLSFSDDERTADVA